MRLEAVLLCGALLATSPVLAVEYQAIPESTDTVSMRQANETKTNNVYATTGYYLMQSRKLTVSGLEFNLGFRHARDEHLSFGPRLRQAYAADNGYPTLYTAFSIDLDYALTGRMTLDEGNVLERETSIFRYRERNVGGWRITGSMSQFFINTINVAVPFSGPGVGLRYDFSSEGPLTITCGAGIDRLTNTEIMLVPFQVYAGLVQIL